MIRKSARHQPPLIREARLVLSRLILIPLDLPLLEAAADIPPPVLRSLDAIHLAAALSLGEALEAVVTYDHRMAEAARALGIIAESPGAA